MKFCEKLKEARTKAGLKQEELAKALGVSLRTISNYESGERYPKKREVYYKLAELFHTEENYFLNDIQQIARAMHSDTNLVALKTDALIAQGYCLRHQEYENRFLK